MCQIVCDCVFLLMRAVVFCRTCLLMVFFGGNSLFLVIFVCSLRLRVVFGVAVFWMFVRVLGVFCA